MSSSTTEKYSKSKLIGLKTEYSRKLYERKLETEVLNIKNQVFKANSEGRTNFTYTYHYNNDDLIDDYFPDLLNKLAICFYDSDISYSLGINSDPANAIKAEYVFTKAESILAELINTMNNPSSDSELSNAVSSAFETVKNSKEIASLKKSHFSDITYNLYNHITTSNSLTNPNPLLNNYDNQTTKINIIKIDWSTTSF